ncbi:PLP-dependent transferase [Trichodelitschia bisporula]|uniref:PLP-dependent transferase n=1 Tax=Trichodelitschia bisporula TaxID=703511 RepID=A0A6G1I9X0_9PEZI|nr:PLP-dependent transferase [Trichodelitschia bisporula]
MEDFKPAPGLETALHARLQKRLKNSTLRRLTTAPTGSIDFSSNDFLSLSTSPLLRETFLSELAAHPTFPLGSGGSRLLDGNSPYALALESTIATFHRAPAALLFNSGFDANAGVFACVPQPGDVIVHDALIHASVHDGMRLSRASKTLPFAHNDVDDLERILTSLLASHPGLASGQTNGFIALESVYSMDGDIAPLAAITTLTSTLFPHRNAHIILDEAHGTGVLGPQGRGLVCALGLENRIFARLHTFGKALAAGGAAVLCSPLVREYLVNYARPLIYTTFMPFPSLAGVRAAYGLLESGATKPLVKHLTALTAYMHALLLGLLGRYKQYPNLARTLSVAADPPPSPIFSLQTEHPRSLAAWCQEGGFVVRAVVPPTVPTRRVRVCLHAGNSREEVEALVASIEEWVKGRLEGESGRAKL